MKSTEQKNVLVRPTTSTESESKSNLPKHLGSATYLEYVTWSSLNDDQQPSFLWASSLIQESSLALIWIGCHSSRLYFARQRIESMNWRLGGQVQFLLFRSMHYSNLKPLKFALLIVQQIGNSMETIRRGFRKTPKWWPCLKKQGKEKKNVKIWKGALFLLLPALLPFSFA